jgi:hypothetical protein
MVTRFQPWTDMAVVVPGGTRIPITAPPASGVGFLPVFLSRAEALEQYPGADVLEITGPGCALVEPRSPS